MAILRAPPASRRRRFFGTQFRVYSFATLATVLVIGALAAPYGTRLAAGQPTPGFGILERINIYGYLLWVAVLAVALLRHSPARPLDLASESAKAP